jgi:hypothetical protein
LCPKLKPSASTCPKKLLRPYKGISSEWTCLLQFWSLEEYCIWSQSGSCYTYTKRGKFYKPVHYNSRMRSFAGFSPLIKAVLPLYKEG